MFLRCFESNLDCSSIWLWRHIWLCNLLLLREILLNIPILSTIVTHSLVECSLIRVVNGPPIFVTGHFVATSSKVILFALHAPLRFHVSPKLLVMGANLRKFSILLDLNDPSSFLFSPDSALSIPFSLIWVSTFLAIQMTTFKVVANFTVGPKSASSPLAKLVNLGEFSRNQVRN